MQTEIERRFLLSSFTPSSPGKKIKQGYLSASGVTTRVRIVDGVQAFLTLKMRPLGSAALLSVHEFEYEIPARDAELLMAHCTGRIIQKTRYCIPQECGQVFEIDVFGGALEHLIIAEVELKTEDEHVSIPPAWGPEITGDNRLSNSSLSALDSADALDIAGELLHNWLA